MKKYYSLSLTFIVLLFITCLLYLITGCGNRVNPDTPTTSSIATTTTASSTTTVTGTTTTATGTTTTTTGTTTSTTTASTSTTTAPTTSTSTSSTTSTTLNPATFKITYAGSYEGSNCNIFTINLDGSDREQLTTDSLSNAPFFTSEKGKIVFVDSNPTPEIYSMNSDGSNKTNLTNCGPYNVEPSISPDDLQVLFASSRSGTLQIWKMNINGSSQTQVTSIGADTWGPKFVPNDNSHFLFNSDAATGRGTLEDIYIANIDGSSITRLTSAEGLYNNSYPTISRDGTKFVYFSWRGGYSDVWVRNIDGSGAINLSNSSYSSNNGEPSISYDGTKVVFQSDRSGTYEVYSVDIAGSALVQLTSIGKNYKPQYLPNGQILFFSERGGNVQIYKMDGDGNNQTNVTNNVYVEGDGFPTSSEKPNF